VLVLVFLVVFGWMIYRLFRWLARRRRRRAEKAAAAGTSPAGTSPGGTTPGGPAPGGATPAGPSWIGRTADTTVIGTTGSDGTAPTLPIRTD